MLGRILLTGLVALAAAAPAQAATAIDGRGTLVVDGTPMFALALLKPPPLGSATPWGTDGLGEVTGAGINLLGAGPLGVPWTEDELTQAQAWDAAAATLGVHTWVHLRELARATAGSPEEAMLDHVVTTLRGDPALALWKGVDEPWWSGYSPELLQPPFDRLKALDPARPQLILEAARGTPADLAPYAAMAEVHGVDSYPVRFRSPRPNLHWVGTWVRRLRTVTPSRAVWATLAACFSGSKDPAGSGAIVRPTAPQLRFMAYDAILNGARGLVLFGNHNTWCLAPGETGWSWSYWTSTLRPLVRELGPAGRLYPALAAPGSGVGVRTSDGRTPVVSRVSGRNLWVIAARHGGGTKRVTFRGLPKGLRGGWVYREGRTVRARGGALTDTFRQWDVHVYRFLLPAR